MNYILHVTTCTCTCTCTYYGTCTYYDTLTYMYCIPSLGTTVPPYLAAGSVYVQYMNCHHQISIQLEVSHVVIVGKLSQMGSVCFSFLTLSLARSL